MNAQNLQDKPKVLKESKNKIKVDFERTDAKTRFKEKYISFFFLTKVVWFVFRLVLLVGISYIVLYPFFTKVAGSFMAPEDFVDVTVRLIPKNWTLDTYKGVLTELNYWEAFGNTLLLSGSCALLQTFVCATIGYGFAKYKFKANGLIFLLVMLTMIVPHQTLELSLFMKFRYFDLFGILSFFSGGASVGIEAIDNILGSIKILPWANGINLCNSYWPLLILSATGLAFKNGLYVFMLRQFFTGVPDALEESAYIDGSGVFRTFFTIILPLSIPMMVTVFLFAFCWQWTDDFYTELFFTTSKIALMPDVVDIPQSLQTDYAGQNMYYTAIRNTCGICIIMPLVILYSFGQKFLVQGIERSGLTAE
jgi:multiple sugar transport system permease protein